MVANILGESGDPESRTSSKSSLSVVRVAANFVNDWHSTCFEDMPLRIAAVSSGMVFSAWKVSSLGNMEKSPSIVSVFSMHAITPNVLTWVRGAKDRKRGAFTHPALPMWRSLRSSSSRVTRRLTKSRGNSAKYPPRRNILRLGTFSGRAANHFPRAPPGSVTRLQPQTADFGAPTSIEIAWRVGATKADSTEPRSGSMSQRVFF